MESICAWKQALETIIADEKILASAQADNEWFLPELQVIAIQGLISWLEIDRLEALQRAYPKVAAQKRVGLILAGNIPLVGFHDLFAVLLAGHTAVVKASHKDRVLMTALFEKSPALLKERIEIVEGLANTSIDFLIGTGSNNTARQIKSKFAHLPLLMRSNRYSVAILKGNETDTVLDTLSRDVLLYHGMGCRSISNIFVPKDYELQPLLSALDRFPKDLLASSWWDVQRYQTAIGNVLGKDKKACAAILVKEVERLAVPNFGELNIIRYTETAQYWGQLSTAKDEIQCVVGDGFIPFGEAQCPEVDDWADGVDVLEILTKL